MTAIETLAYELTQAAKTERRHHAIGRLWQNLPPLSSYAGENGQTEIDPKIKRKKDALRKSWPELAAMLDDVADLTPRR